MDPFIIETSKIKKLNPNLSLGTLVTDIKTCPFYDFVRVYTILNTRLAKKTWQEDI